MALLAAQCGPLGAQQGAAVPAVEPARLLEMFDTKRLVLTHIAPGEVDETATIAAARPIYQGEVIVGHDLLETTPVASAAQVAPASPKVGGNGRWFVKSGTAAAATADGRTWATAMPDLQAALAAAEVGGGGIIWVTAGTYLPTAGTDRAQSFKLRLGVALYGGFIGTETTLDQRDWEKYPTVLSGDIGKSGVATDNVYSIVTGANNAVLDGFTISGGYALDGGGPGGPAGSGPPPSGTRPGGTGAPGAGGPIHITPQTVLSGPGRGSGAGIMIYQCAPVIRNCTFSGNTCDGKGGAIYNDFGCSPTLANCLFTGNRAPGGGALGNDGGSAPLLVHCTFSGNEATQEGAALYQGTGPANNPIVSGCILWGNRCAEGPADNSDHVLIGEDQVGVRSVMADCVFEANEARWRGGAAMFDYGARPRLSKCHFTNNQSGCHGGALAMVSRASQLENTIACLTDCTFEANRATGRGGAIAAADSAIFGLKQCELTKHTAGTGGGALALESRARAILLECRETANTSRAGTRRFCAPAAPVKKYGHPAQCCLRST